MRVGNYRAPVTLDAQGNIYGMTTFPERVGDYGTLYSWIRLES